MQTKAVNWDHACLFRASKEAYKAKVEVDKGEHFQRILERYREVEGL